MTSRDVGNKKIGLNSGTSHNRNIFLLSCIECVFFGREGDGWVID